MDEAGTDLKSPILIVASVMINPNKQVKLVEQRMEEIRRTHPLLKDLPNFYFHAKDIMNNKIWTREQGLDIIGKYIDLIYDCGLTAVIHWWTKSEVDTDKSARKGFTMYSQEAQIIDHATAFIWNLTVCNSLIEYVWPDDIGVVFAEDCNKMNKYLRYTFRNIRDNPDILTSPTHIELLKGGLHHIKNGINFCEKEDSPALQIADACAFALSRYINRSEGGDFLIHCLNGRPDFQIRPDISKDSSGCIIRSFIFEQEHWNRYEAWCAGNKLDHSVFDSDERDAL